MYRLSSVVERTFSLSPRRGALTRALSDASRGTASQETHFGFQTVKSDEKERLVGEVFRRVADKYVWRPIYVLDQLNGLNAGST